jgi:PAS domain S-box-containing protein
VSAIFQSTWTEAGKDVGQHVADVAEPQPDAVAAAVPDWALRVVEAALDAVVTIDAAGRIVQFNPAAERMSGYGRTEAIGEPLVSLVIPEDLRAAYLAGLLRVVESGESEVLDRRLETRALRRSGEEFPVELTVTRVADSPPLFTGFVRDLSALHEATSRGSRIERDLSAAERLGAMGRWELDLRTGHAVWSDELYRIHGLEPGAVEPGVDMLLGATHPEDRTRLRELLETIVEHPERIPAEGVTLEYRAVRSDGSVREIRAHGRIEHDERGEPVRWLGPARDVTEQRGIERELHAHYALEQALRDWQTFDEGVVGLLRRLGIAMNFATGSLWVHDPKDDALVCRAFWTAPGFDAGEFEIATRGVTFKPGKGVPGAAWEARQPVIETDLRSMLDPRRAAAAERLGLRSGLAFPAVADDGSLAVLSYHSLDRRTPTERLARTLTGLGREIGRFLSGRRADLGMGTLTARELQVLRLAAEGRSGPQIAESLVVSPATVKTHFENIYEKLGVSDRAAAVAFAMRMGLIC